MEPQPAQQPAEATQDGHEAPAKTRTESFSAESETSQTAADFIRDQMQLEADAREALPYSIENCTKPLGPLRQAVFSCLTCNPPPADPKAPYNAAGVCYSCSVQCHGEHTLVEIFAKRNFTCDCGTARFPATSPCNLRINEETGTKGGLHSEEPDANNKYNHNFRNRFCGCECDYDPFEQQGTMFQCLGLGTAETGGCGEDWYHPGCIVGLGPDWYEKMEKKDKPKNSEVKTEIKAESGGPLPTIVEDETAEQQNGTNAEEAEAEEDDEDDDPPPPPGFPADDEFEGFICYKCVEAYPWIKRYAGTQGFLPPVYLKKEAESKHVEQITTGTSELEVNGDASSKKRKASDEDNVDIDESQEKKPKTEEVTISETVQSTTTTTFTTESIITNVSSTTTAAFESTSTTLTTTDIPMTTDSPAPDPSADPDTSTAAQTKPCLLSSLPPPPSSGPFSLFFTTPDFRSSLCHCPTCFPLLLPHPQLLEEEETYEPPVSESGSHAPDLRSQHGGGSTGSGSLLERGESALRNIDRVRAIEGVMAYNHLKDKLKPFFKEFAESGRAVSAEDIKAYFAKLRGDEEVKRNGGETEEEAVAGDTRKEQDGY
ncbi:putative zinc finger in N-recognin-domain-containing protein [Pseudoneurospora amorphoporcata]|uniref:Zinc finger in N-recognin-domain-containing protein n=1 Tax=Pseudoneurospora amorphoporcata TaxID=241081 RepID=A0AAN6P3T1_9PEZI|nr:putative zinc finger in N-recognin-domain-containing protein [Pseudoneurospora amorphoporcata]